MSSAAGLSAAKRRRGAGASNTTQASSNQVKTQNQNQNQHVGPQIPGGMPPLGQLLYVHEERLRRLEKLVPEEGLDSTNDENVIDREEFVNVVQMINTELGKMKQMVSDLQSTVLSNSSAIKSATENVKESVVADVTDELNNVTITVEETAESNDTKGKKKKAVSLDSN